MLCAVAEDFARIAGIEVETTWDRRLGPPRLSGVHVHCAESPQAEWRLFRALAAECDATLVIAPEFDGILQERSRIVEELGGRLLGPSSSAVAICADKLRLAGILKAAGVSTIPTTLLTWEGARLAPTDGGMPEFPAVIKPRDGAGSLDVRLIRSADEIGRLADGFPPSPPVLHLPSPPGRGAGGEGGLSRSSLLAEEKHDSAGTNPAARCRELIIQPFICGRALSVALIVPPAGEPIEVFPPAEQILSDDGQFRYLGGRVPAADVDAHAVQAVAQAACRAVPGLRGYVGVDLILPERAAGSAIVVEINPRLTTSYLGYRELAEANLAERLLSAERARPPISWRAGVVLFDANGRA